VFSPFLGVHDMKNVYLTCDLYMTPASFRDFMKEKEFWRWTASVLQESSVHND
jgi:hypothetical protein